MNKVIEFMVVYGWAILIVVVVVIVLVIWLR